MLAVSTNVPSYSDQTVFSSISEQIPVGDVGEPGDKGSIGKAIEGPVGDQGEPGMFEYPIALY